MPVKEVRLKWNPAQTKFLLATQRFVDFEGAIRAGKSTPAIWKIINYCLEHPGIHCLISRWNDKALKGQLRPLFYDSCPVELLKAWHAGESYQEFHNGSRVYMRGLKSAQELNRYANLAGMTLSVIYVDQPEEMPFDFHTYLVGRLSQPGYPHQLLYTPNPPAYDHWLTKEFPDGSDPTQKVKADHLYLRTSVYDNAANLDPIVIRTLEEQFPVGTVERHRMVEGRRGLSTIGEPVYRGYFRRDLHVREIFLNPQLPLIRGWDFGHKHPAVAFGQFTSTGGFRILHEVMGDAQFIEDFAPHILTVTRSVFPDAGTVWDCCDPAGADMQGHGLRRTALDVLSDLGVYPRIVKGSNDPARRDFAIQTLARFMARLTKDGAAFEIHPRCRILSDGFEAGYVWEERDRTGSVMPNTRRPKKDGYYDHLQNCCEYIMLNFAGAAQTNWREKVREGGTGPRDRDPADTGYRPRGGLYAPSRAGY